MYSFSLKSLPTINRVYTVTRNTIWKIAEPFDILIVILDGKCNLSFEGKEYILEKGSACIIPRNHIYTRSPLEDGSLCTLFYAHFRLDTPFTSLSKENAFEIISKIRDAHNLALVNDTPIPQETCNLGFSYTVVQLNEDYEEVLELIEKSMTDRMKSSIENSVLLSIHISEILATISKQTLQSFEKQSTQQDESLLPQKLKKAIIYIRQNISSPITLDELCSFAHISKAQLNRYFKTEFNTTPIKYINEFRVNLAKEMMVANPQLTFKDVSEGVGFTDPNYFSRIFTQYTGETPRDYRYRVVNYGKITIPVR